MSETHTDLKRAMPRDSDQPECLAIGANRIEMSTRRAGQTTVKSRPSVRHPTCAFLRRFPVGAKVSAEEDQPPSVRAHKDSSFLVRVPIS
jgi:hypothetical protein